MLPPTTELALRLRQLLDAFQRVQLHHNSRLALQVVAGPLGALTLHPSFPEHFPTAAAALPAGELEDLPAHWPAFLAGLLADATPAKLQWLSNALVGHASDQATVYAGLTTRPSSRPIAQA